MSATRRVVTVDRRGVQHFCRARHLNRFHEGVLVAQEVIHLDTTQTKLNGDLHPVGPKKRFNIDKFQRSFTTVVVRRSFPSDLAVERRAARRRSWAADPEANLPSPSAVHLDVSNMYKEMQPMVRELLHKAEALLSFTQG